jgi:hypothetical protein
MDAGDQFPLPAFGQQSIEEGVAFAVGEGGLSFRQ